MYDSLYVVLSYFWDRMSQNRQAQNRSPVQGQKIAKSIHPSCDRHHSFPCLYVTNALEQGHFGSLCSLALFASLPVGVCEFRQAPVRRRWCHCVAPEGSRCPARHESLSSENENLNACRGSFERVNWSHLEEAHKRVIKEKEMTFFFFTKHSVWDFWSFTP